MGWSSLVPVNHWYMLWISFKDQHLRKDKTNNIYKSFSSGSSKVYNEKKTITELWNCSHVTQYIKYNDFWYLVCWWKQKPCFANFMKHIWKIYEKTYAVTGWDSVTLILHFQNAMNYDILTKIMARKQTTTNALGSTTLPCKQYVQVLALTCLRNSSCVGLHGCGPWITV
jgi:hypothetical protein